MAGGRVTRETIQTTHNESNPFEAHDADVFLPYEAIVARLEDAARQLPGASVVHRDGTRHLEVGSSVAI